jgi:hypothetical protein
MSGAMRPLPAGLLTLRTENFVIKGLQICTKYYAKAMGGGYGHVDMHILP